MRGIATEAGLNLKLVTTYEMITTQLAESWEARVLKHFDSKRVSVNSDYMQTGPMESRFDRRGVEKFSDAQVIAGLDGMIRSPVATEWIATDFTDVQSYIDKMLGREAKASFPEPTTLAALAAAEEENG
jgi:hypothetical protein